LSDRELERLRWELAKVMHEEDALLIVDLCPSCASRVVHRNHVDGWTEQETTFEIIDGNQAPARVRRSRSSGAGSSPAEELDSDR
jgi:hypothetical protein